MRAVLQSVNDVKKEILDTLAEVAHEALEIGADVLEFVPIAGLAEAARILAGIWDAVQLVEVMSPMRASALDISY